MIIQKIEIPHNVIIAQRIYFTAFPKSIQNDTLLKFILKNPRLIASGSPINGKLKKK